MCIIVLEIFSKKQKIGAFNLITERYFYSDVCMLPL